MILLLSSNDKLPKKKKKKTDSESEKRLDFDEDFKSKTHINLEEFVNANSSTLMLVSQSDDDKNYIENFEESARATTGSQGFECAIDFSKSKLFDTQMDSHKPTVGKILFENMGFNSTLVVQPESYE